ncbi:MAG: hypothetical protein KIT86_12370 [Hydrogenophaga sp.]|jgi:hypothetical protein|uniref:hypothetical protein n=1 Tax=Hydrogenophaga sp. TaxID=1904254 RepID=UPI002629BCA5|nr:hypothetical protein [Hydrogenophaga sp.]MCW5670454.1 hypothetical protein [Hydrogenophaga sp.]
MNLCLRLDELERIKRWHVVHRRDHPLEYQLWDGMLTAWVMGWVGCVPAFFSDALWLLPFCVMGIWAPGLYVGWRRKVHRSHRLRCDWLGPPN